MNVPARLFLGLVLLVSAAVFAQEASPAAVPTPAEGAANSDVVLERYALANSTLAESLTTLSTDPSRSLEMLQRASVVLGPLAQDSASTTLVSGMEATFDRARTAIENRSPTDLTVQIALLDGGFRRLVYEAALRAGKGGDMDTASRRLIALAKDMKLPPSTLQSLSKPITELEVLRATFEGGVAQAVLSEVQRSRTFIGQDKSAVYRVLGRSYGVFTPVQDSPRLPAEANSSFVAALKAVIEDDQEELTAQLDILETQLSNFSQAAATVTNTVTPLNPDASEGEAASETVATPASESAASAVSTTAADSETPAQPALPTASSAEEAADATTMLAAKPAPKIAPDEVAQNLAAFGLSEAQQEPLAAEYRRVGLQGPQEAVEALYAQGARILGAVQAGDMTATDDLLTDFGSSYRTLLQPIVVRQNAPADTQMVNLLNTLEEASALRLQDIALLIDQVEGLEQILGSVAPVTSQALALQASTTWIGLVRTVLMILLGLVAFVPLYLLNLAFGGGNRNWQWVGAALFLLLLPVIYEGFSFLGSLLTDLTGLEPLNVLAEFSIFQSTLAQLVWVVLTAIAIGFATAGLYGICVQFGLLGKQKAESPVGATSERHLSATSANLSPNTIVDWDEEY